MGRPPTKLAEALRGLRRRLGLSMSEVSRRTGIAISTLSKVESGKMSLTYDKLSQLCQGLDVDFADFLSGSSSAPSDTSAKGRRSINRVGDGVVVRTEHYDHCYLSTDVSGKAFAPLIASPRSHSISDFPDYLRHGGEEFVYVLEGALEVHSEYYKPVILKTGESMWLDSQMGHAYVAHGDAPCRVLAVCSGREAELIDAVNALDQQAQKPD